MAKVTPKEQDAAAFNCSAFAAPTCLRLSFASSSARVCDETASKSMGEENCRRISFEVLPNDIRKNGLVFWEDLIQHTDNFTL